MSLVLPFVLSDTKHYVLMFYFQEEVDDLRKEEVRKKAVQRQIEQMKKKLSIKAEL